MGIFVHGRVGRNFAAAEIMNEYDVSSRLLWCSTSIDCFAVLLRCIEHAAHNGARHFVEAVAPTPPQPLNKIRQLLQINTSNISLERLNPSHYIYLCNFQA